MASEVNLSLEDYIRTNQSKFSVKGKKPVNRRPGVGSAQKNGVSSGGVAKNKLPQNKAGVKKKAIPGGGAVSNPGPPVVDARLKIIEKTRSKISDARDRLNQRLRQKDARSRITPKGRTTGAVTKRVPPASALPRRTLTSTSRETGRFRGVSNLSSGNRRNGFSTRPPPRGPIGSGGSLAYMDLERVRDQVNEAPVDWGSRIQALPRLQIHVPTSRGREQLRPQSLLPSLSHRTHMDIETDSWSRSSQKPTVPSVMYRSRDSMKSRLEPLRQDGFRIVVSNLQPSVTHEDIKELFEDVGVLIGSRVVRPGTAEVVYKSLDDAITAVDTYHNRQLDGQPMKCLLVKSSRSSTKSGRDIQPDISVVHHALFTK